MGRLEQPQSGCAQFYEKNGRKGKVPSGLPGTGGLPTPRAASEIHMPDEAVMNTEGEDVTAEFLLGADFALREAKKYDCTIAILKERSPSCGSNGIYDGTFSHKLREGMGKTAALLAGYGLKVYGESRLKELEAVINSGELT